MTIYTRTDLNQILRAYGEEFNFDQTTPRVLRTLSTHKLLENGLWLVGYDPSISAGETPAERTLFEWHPRQNIDLPALPIPFTENELAAFFLDGGGWFLHQHFRDSSANGLSDEALEGLRENSANARDALQQAHALYLLAASRFDLNDDAGIRGAAEWLLQPAAVVVPQEPRELESRPWKPQGVAGLVRFDPALEQSHAAQFATVVVTHRVNAEQTAPRFAMKKNTLVQTYSDRWPSVARDIADASSNGLSKAAKAGRRDWWEVAALEWARNAGKLIEEFPASPASPMPSLASLPRTRHTLKG
jgi:hypothetical protein